MPPCPFSFTAFAEPRLDTPQGPMTGRDLPTLAATTGLTLEGGGVVPTPEPIPLPVCDAPGRRGEIARICTLFEALRPGRTSVGEPVDGNRIRAADPTVPCQSTDRVDGRGDPVRSGPAGRCGNSRKRGSPWR